MTTVKGKKLNLEQLQKVFKSDTDIRCMEIVDGKGAYSYMTNGVFAIFNEYFGTYDIYDQLTANDNQQIDMYSDFNFLSKNPVSKKYYTFGISPNYNDYANIIIGELNDYYIIKNYNRVFPVYRKIYDFLTKNGFNIFVPEDMHHTVEPSIESKTSNNRYYWSGYYAIFHKSRSNPQFYLTSNDLPLVDGVFMSNHTTDLTVEELDKSVDEYLLNEPLEKQVQWVKESCCIGRSCTENKFMELLHPESEDMFRHWMYKQLLSNMSEREIKQFYKENN